MWKRILSGEFLIAAAAARFCRVRLFVTPWTVACQAPLSIGFSRQQYCNGLPCPPPGNFPNPGIETMSLVAPALQADSSPLRPLWRPLSSLKAYCLWSDTNAYIQVSLRVTVIKYNFVIYLLNFWQIITSMALNKRVVGSMRARRPCSDFVFNKFCTGSPCLIPDFGGNAFSFLFKRFIHLLAVVGLCYYTQAFIPWLWWAGATLSLLCAGVSMTVASLCGPWTLGSRASVVVAHGLSISGKQA